MLSKKISNLSPAFIAVMFLFLSLSFSSAFAQGFLASPYTTGAYAYQNPLAIPSTYYNPYQTMYPYQPTYTNPYQPTYINPYQPTYTNPYQPTYTNPYQPTYINPYQPTYTNPYQPTYTNPYQPTYTNPYQPTYTNPYQPTYTNPYQPTYTNPYQSTYTNPYQSTYTNPYQPTYTNTYQPTYTNPYLSPSLYTNASIDQTADGKVVKISLGKTLGITLPSNMTTGYQWELDTESLNSSIVSKQSSQYLPTTSTALGANGYELWIFSAVSRGTTIIKLEYKRYWETTVGDTFEIEVIVE